MDARSSSTAGSRRATLLLKLWLGRRFLPSQPAGDFDAALTASSASAAPQLTWCLRVRSGDGGWTDGFATMNSAPGVIMRPVAVMFRGAPMP
eukprot:scaffold3161_cov118-Isochrysis_galbana.AAC.22